MTFEEVKKVLEIVSDQLINDYPVCEVCKLKGTACQGDCIENIALTVMEELEGIK